MIPFLPLVVVVAAQSPPASDTVSYANGPVRIAASFARPASSAPVPAVVIIHGSGASARDNPWTAAWAKALVERGMAVLYPDKRGSGGSGGDWRTASFADLAGDAEKGVEWLRAQRGIDTSRVGVIAFSQGGYVAAALAGDSTKARFAIVVSGGVRTFSNQMVDEIVVEEGAQGAPLDSVQVSLLHGVYRAAFAVAAGRGSWPVLQALTAAGRAHSPALARALRSLPPDSSHWAYRWVGRVGDYDPIPSWKRARMPVAFLWGGRDNRVQVPLNVRMLWDGVGVGDPRFTVLVFQGNGHALFRDDALAFLGQWVRDRGVP